MINTALITQLANTAAEEKTGIAVLGIDPKAIILQAGTFLLLFLIIRKFALKGIVEQLEQRRKTIDKGVELGLEMEKAKLEFDEHAKQLQREARGKADEIIAAAQNEAGAIVKQGEITATAKIDQMLRDAEGRIEREMNEARDGLRSEMLALVAEATEVIIDEKLDDKKDASLIERAMARIRA